MSSMSTNTYRLGCTFAAVGLSAVIEVIPPNGANGAFFKHVSGGTAMLTNGLSGPMFTNILYPVPTTDLLQFAGPAKFYLTAAGATAIVALGWSYSSGAGSTQIAGG